MSDVQFKLDYDEHGARQVGNEIVPAAAPRVAPIRHKRTFRLPAAANTAITVLICGGVFFAAVRFAPEGWRPQDFSAEYASEISGEVKAEEGAVQAELDAYINAMRAAYEQRNAQYGRIVEGYLEAYRAAVALNQQQLDANNRLRGAYVDRQASQTMQANGTNIGIANTAELIGNLQNWIEPGSGDATLGEASRQRSIAADRLEGTARESANVDLTNYVNALPSEEALRRRIDSLPPIELPPPPRFDRKGR